MIQLCLATASNDMPWVISLLSVLLELLPMLISLVCLITCRKSSISKKALSSDSLSSLKNLGSSLATALPPLLAACRMALLTQSSETTSTEAPAIKAETPATPELNKEHLLQLLQLIEEVIQDA